MGVAQRLKDLREAAGLSQAELARETGLTRKSINYIRDSLTVLLCAMEQDEFCAEEISRYAKMLTVYASLSAEGQKEMLKRLDEYKCFDLSKHPSD